MLLTESKELLSKHVDDMWLCCRCSLCKFPPLAQIKSHRFSSVCCSMDYGFFHAWSGSGKIIMGLSLLEKRVEKITEPMRDALLQCTLCGACDVSCKYSTNIEVFDTIFDVRRYMVKAIGAHPVHLKYLAKVEEFHNPYGEPHTQRQQWLESTKAVHNDTAKTLFFTGCTAAYRHQDMAKASVEVLSAGELEFRVSEAEWCCGSPIYRSGQVDDAIKYFEHNIGLFSAMGIEEVITACPGCYSMFVAEYPKYLNADLLGKWKKIKFRHMVEVLEDFIAKKKIIFAEEPQNRRLVVTYHDPCHLGRGSEPWIPEWEGTEKKVYNQIKVYDPPKKTRRGTRGIYKAPRFILKQLKNSGVEFVEMFRINEYAYCCGSGGGVKAAYPEMALAASMERLEEAEAVLKSKVEELLKMNESVDEMVVVSACPFCKTNFEEAIAKSGKRIRYLDINQLVNERITKEGVQ